MQKLYYGYDHFLEDTKVLAKKVEVFHADTLLAIARGGVTLGHFLASALDNRRLFTINSIHYNHEEKLETFDIFNIPDIGNAKKVLLIDDIIDSGETMKEIVGILKKRYPLCEFKIASLFYRKTALIQPDFAVKEATQWIEFFWEVDI